MKKRILTGITTTGTPHIGNYIGAIRPALDLVKDSNDSFFFLADYHSIIKNQNSDEISASVKNIALAWLSCGLDTNSSYFYRQSDIPEIIELSWILNCVTSKGLMNRAHAYKAASSLNKKDPDKRDYFVSNKKIEKYGYKPRVSLETGIKELSKIYEINDFKDNKNNY